MLSEPVLFVIFRTNDLILDHFILKKYPATTFCSDVSSRQGERSATDCAFTFSIQDFNLLFDPHKPLTLVERSEELLYFPGMSTQRASLKDLIKQCQRTSFHQPHKHFTPVILPSKLIKSDIEYFSVFQESHLMRKVAIKNEGQIKEFDSCGRITPKHRCIIIVDAYVASCLKNELSFNSLFCRKFLHNISHTGGFKTCVPCKEPEKSNVKTASMQCIDVNFMIEILAVWPLQIVDYAWSMRILGLLNKHVVLEEGLAWLSTLGGAHSSLGEAFLHHAERAGEISVHQFKLAKELGNEIMIARCYLYWSWSQLQRGYLARCKKCVIKTWNYCQQLKCCDRVLYNMCQAVWTRLKYEKSIRRNLKAGKSLENGTIFHRHRKEGNMHAVEA